MIEKALFGNFEGKDVYRFEICDGDMRVNLIEYGAAIQSLYFGVSVQGRLIQMGEGAP